MTTVYILEKNLSLLGYLIAKRKRCYYYASLMCCRQEITYNIFTSLLNKKKNIRYYELSGYIAMKGDSD
jgi:hypothetical protein